MKTLVLALAFLSSPAVAGEPLYAAFEAPAGCIWRSNHGACMVSNTTAKPLKCKMKIFVRTMKVEHKIEQIVTVQPGMYSETERFFSEPGDKMKDMSVTAICKPL